MKIEQLEQLALVAEKHAEYRDWYREAREAAAAFPAVLLSLLAATSPRMTVAQNVAAALDALVLAESGRPIVQGAGRFMPSHIPNIERALAGEQLSGPKVSAFERNLLGDESVVTVDVHMFRLFDTEPKPAHIPRVSAGVEFVARLLDWTPAQAQAALWVYQRGPRGRHGLGYAECLQAARVRHEL